MRIFRALGFLSVLLASLEAAEMPVLTEAQRSFRSEVAARFATAEKDGVAAVAGEDGWLFLAAELRLISLDRFWGPDAVKISRLAKPELSDPVPAILDFQKQLQERGIDLLLVPVPPKAAVYPGKVAAGASLAEADPAPTLSSFYDELRAAGVDVLDLAPLFREKRDDARGPVFCQTDTHWSGFGCALAGQAIAEKIQAKLHGDKPGNSYEGSWKEIQIDGDLRDLLAPTAPRPPAEKLQVQCVSEAGSGSAVTPDANSPVLLIGDSHTLVFHDFFGERAGLVDQLALNLGFAPDLIGTRGSGATPVRISLYRRSGKDPEYLSRKKIVVWCFTAREFTEAAQGWPKVPISK